MYHAKYTTLHHTQPPSPQPILSFMLYPKCIIVQMHIVNGWSFLCTVCKETHNVQDFRKRPYFK
jgi:hypothetical protein